MYRGQIRLRILIKAILTVTTTNTFFHRACAQRSRPPLGSPRHGKYHKACMPGRAFQLLRGSRVVGHAHARAAGATAACGRARASGGAAHVIEAQLSRRLKVPRKAILRRGVVQVRVLEHRCGGHYFLWGQP